MENRKDLEILFQKFVNNSCTKEELEKLLIQITLPENMEFLENALDENWQLKDHEIYSGQNIDQDQDLLLRFRVASLRKTSENLSIEQAKTRVHIYQLFLKIAAVILLVVFSGIIMQDFFIKRGSKQIVSAKTVIPFNSVKVAKPGERLNLKLPDGTLVTVKSGSQLVSPEKFEGKQRNIKLNGEAFFRVKPDKTKPFIISTNNFIVKVLGTSFNVYSYDKENFARVTVKTGRVEVMIKKTKINKLISYVLYPGDQIELNKNTGESTLKSIDVNRTIDWTDEELNFDHTPLPEVIQRIEKCYGVTVLLHFPNAMKTEITGKYRNDNLTGILRLLSFSTSTTFSIKDNQVMIDKK